jgi:hypothetical protein
MPNQHRISIAFCIALVALLCGEPRSVWAGDASGSLVVESDPVGASVYVDGRLAGETPLTLPAIAAGVHRVRVVRLGYLENSRLVTVKSGTRATLRARLTDPAPQTAQAAALKIVVVEGEGAVNIIQQKTAVAPVIEVRDRNDQPVAGAVVRFAIQKGRASFNGVRTLTATTDALGRATATGLTPTGSGALQIGTSAAFQGQTAAITIAQTNVLTAAQAATAATTGTGAGAGGGGLSNLAIAGIVGGAGAGIGGALIASRSSSSKCGGSVLCGVWDVVFSPNLNVSACEVNPFVQGGLTGGTINVDAGGRVNGGFGGSGAGFPAVLEVQGTLSATGFAGTMRCMASPATGTLSATPSGGDYIGTATLNGTTVSMRVSKKSPESR